MVNTLTLYWWKINCANRFVKKMYVQNYLFDSIIIHFYKFVLFCLIHLI